MRGIRVALAVLFLAATTGCSPRPIPGASGVAPQGVWAFSGTVDGEVVNGTLAFSDPIVVSGSHGRCVREIEGIHRWGGLFRVACPGFALAVRVEGDGSLQGRGTARLKKTGMRQERTTCRTWNRDRDVCLAWNTALVEYDRWVEGRVEVTRRPGEGDWIGRGGPRGS